MKPLDIDILETKLIMRYRAGESNEATHNRIYFGANEDLKKIFSNFQLCDKDVLSVVGSGDQAFHLYNLGVSKLNLFDINVLSYYYFYLRMWVIKYMGSYYPEFNFNKKYVLDILKHVSPISEEEKYIYDYWLRYSNELLDLYSSDRLFIGDDKDLISSNDISDTSEIIRRIEISSFSFYRANIATNDEIEGKYDFIYISNIPDYVNTMDGVVLFRDNLYKLLKDDGIVCCSSVIKGKEISLVQEVVFEELFDYSSLVDKSDGIMYGYCYTKKK